MFDYAEFFHQQKDLEGLLKESGLLNSMFEHMYYCKMREKASDDLTDRVELVGEVGGIVAALVLMLGKEQDDIRLRDNTF